MTYSGAPTFLRGHCATSVIDGTIRGPDLPVTWPIALDTKGSEIVSIHIKIGEVHGCPAQVMSTRHCGSFRSDVHLATADPPSVIKTSLEKAKIESVRLL